VSRLRELRNANGLSQAELAQGDAVTVLIKATEVMLAK
jgi:transcriptional regulator with XRE-family HTH domain